MGASVVRREDVPLVRGEAAFVADVDVPGVADAAFVRSPVAHGVLRRVDLAPARRAPGALVALGAADIGAPRLGYPPRVAAPEGLEWPVLATGRVRYVGEPVAVVVAEDRYRAEDAAESATLHIDPLPAVVDPVAAEQAEPLFEGRGNVVNVRRRGAPVDDVFHSAPVTVEETYAIPRLAHASMEARAILVAPRADGGIDVWCSHQAPHRLRAILARRLGLAAERVRVVVPEVGGAFGGKSQMYPEYAAVALAARGLGRPVRWIEDRREAMQAAAQGRGQVQTVRLAADEDGRLLALDLHVIADIGAYPNTGEFVPSMELWVASGCYRIPRLHAEARMVVTNKVPTASFRGAGRPEAAHALERTIDSLARRLGVDPVELRRRNFIPPAEFPYQSPTGAVYDSGDYEAALDRALELVDYEGVRAAQRERGGGGARRVGVGVATYIERSGGQAGSVEFAAVEVAPNAILARSGSSSQGQGHRTAFAQIVASVLDVDLERVDVVQGDTAAVPAGTGTFGSRSVQVGGNALHVAAERVLAEARRRAEEKLGSEVSYRRGVFASARGSIRLDELGELRADVEFGAPQAFPFGAHAAVVEVDVETGRVELKRLVVVDDCGRILNPLLVRGQAVGSAVHGIGAALFERIAHHDDGSVATTSFVDYVLPTLPVVPEIVAEHTVTPNPNVPLGTKGAGESGAIGVPPAIANAVADALGPGAPALDLPLLPERVRAALE